MIYLLLFMIFTSIQYLSKHTFYYLLQASELDFLEWSPNSVDNILTISDNMSSDTLFSTLSQFPFPDSREIGE